MAGDSPGYSWDAGCEGAARSELQAPPPRARRVKTVNLGAGFARAAHKRPSATLVGNCQLGSLTTGSPAGHLLLQATMLGVNTAVPPPAALAHSRTHGHPVAACRMVAQCTVWPAGPWE